MYSIGIDCGIRYIGISVFKDASLEHCGLLESRNSSEFEAEVLHGLIEALKAWEGLQYLSTKELLRVTIEYPEQYAHSPVPRSSVQGLAYTAGGLSLFFKERFNSEIKLIYPKEWKGQVPKDIFLGRIKSRMSEKELMVLDSCSLPKSKEHNVVDAIGIGLYSLGRLKRR